MRNRLHTKEHSSNVLICDIFIHSIVSVVRPAKENDGKNVNIYLTISSENANGEEKIKVPERKKIQQNATNSPYQSANKAETKESLLAMVA